MPNCICKCYCGAIKQQLKIEEDMRVTQFLMGLSEIYTNIRGQLLMMSPLPE